MHIKNKGYNFVAQIMTCQLKSVGSYGVSPSHTNASQMSSALVGVPLL